MTETKVLDQKLLANRKAILQTVREYYDTGRQYTHNRIIVPHLTDEELLARYRKIKPIVLYEGAYYYLKQYDITMIRKNSYIQNLKENIKDQVETAEAQIIDEFPCYHTYGHIGFFKPTIAEVLEQFPDEVIKEANAFYMTTSPKHHFDVDNLSQIANARCHQSTVKALILKR